MARSGFTSSGLQTFVSSVLTNKITLALGGIGVLVSSVMGPGSGTTAPAYRVRDGSGSTVWEVLAPTGAVNQTGSLTVGSGSVKVILYSDGKTSFGGVKYTWPLSDGTATGKVLKTDANGQLSWSDDNTGGSSVVAGQGLSLNGSVLTLNGSLTGSLLNFATASGNILHARDLLRSSGGLLVEGAATINGVLTLDADDIAVYDAAPTFDSDNQIVTKKYVDDNDANTTYEAGQGINTDGSFFALNSTITGSLVSFDTLSGAILHARDLLHSSGGLLVEGATTLNGAVTFGSTLSLNGVTYTFPTSDGTATGKVLKTDSTGQLSWSDDDSGAVTQEEADDRYVNTSGDTMTGSLTVHGTISGAILSGTTLHVVDGIFDNSVTVQGTLSGTVITARPKIRAISAEITASGTALTTGSGKAMVPIGAELDGYNVIGVEVCVGTPGITGSTEVQIRRIRSAAEVHIFSTAAAVETTEQCAFTSATKGTVNTANDDMAVGDILELDVPSISSGTAPTGLTITIRFELP